VSEKWSQGDSNPIQNLRKQALTCAGCSMTLYATFRCPADILAVLRGATVLRHRSPATLGAGWWSKVSICVSRRVSSATAASRYVEHDPEVGVAGQHAFVRLWGVFERKQFDHWATLLRPQFNQ
jgi:hypothetical protein